MSIRATDPVSRATQRASSGPIVSPCGSLSAGKAISRTCPSAVTRAMRLLPHWLSQTPVVGVGDDGVGAGGAVWQRELTDRAIDADAAHLPGSDLDEPDRVGGRGDTNRRGAGGRKRVDRGVSVDTESSDGVRLVEREPERAVGAGCCSRRRPGPKQKWAD